MAREFGRVGNRVDSVTPGLTQTDITDSRLKHEMPLRSAGSATGATSPSKEETN
ncbi:hypothetical protein [Sinorhizobium psoraleae]|uniref:Uncharacterized protein n=1 Tax=Sinorhizobium psoraleae TaxID=520838 RepID=A0ABT4KN30_9HYPH|nr:hypothetical protein [Sinorhizobium psoraleae]MCZ4093253.1 hypothetical protein [Sinorhizobium psoraleae]